MSTGVARFTSVCMSTGEFKGIENIRKSEIFQCYRLDSKEFDIMTGEVESLGITRNLVFIDLEYRGAGCLQQKTLMITPDTKFILVDGTIKKASEIQRHDELLCETLKNVFVRKLTIVDSPTEIYRIKFREDNDNIAMVSTLGVVLLA